MSGITAAFEEGLLVLTIDEPERRNSVGHAVRREMGLPARIGVARIRRIILASATIGAAEGRRLGFVDEPVPEGGALAASKAIRRHCSRSHAFSRDLVKDFLALGADKALEFEHQIPPPLWFSADALEGRPAFFGKRAPASRGERHDSHR